MSNDLYTVLFTVVLLCNICFLLWQVRSDVDNSYGPISYKVCPSSSFNDVDEIVKANMDSNDNPPLSPIKMTREKRRRKLER